MYSVKISAKCTTGEHGSSTIYGADMPDFDEAYQHALDIVEEDYRDPEYLSWGKDCTEVTIELKGPVVP